MSFSDFGNWLKVRQSRKQIMVFSILPKNKRNSLSILSKGHAQDSSYRNLLTFSDIDRFLMKLATNWQKVTSSEALNKFVEQCFAF